MPAEERRAKNLKMPELPTGFIESLLTKESDKFNLYPPDDKKGINIQDSNSDTESECSFDENNGFWGACAIM